MNLALLLALSKRRGPDMDIFKNYAAAQDRAIERRRELWRECQKLETFEQRKAHFLANREEIIASYPRAPKPDDLQWDYEPSGISSEAFGEISNGELGS